MYWFCCNSTKIISQNKIWTFDILSYISCKNNWTKCVAWKVKTSNQTLEKNNRYMGLSPKLPLKLWHFVHSLITQKKPFMDFNEIWPHCRKLLLWNIWEVWFMSDNRQKLFLKIFWSITMKLCILCWASQTILTSACVLKMSDFEVLT